MANCVTHRPEKARRRDFQKINALIAQGRLETAAEIAYRLAEERPDDVDVLAVLANLALGAGDPRLALAFCDKALATAPRHWEAQTLRATALDRLGRHNEELAIWDDLVSRLPKRTPPAGTPAAVQFALVHYNRAVCLQKLQRLAEALAGYDHVLACDRRSVVALTNRGAVLLGLGRQGEAVQSYRRAMAVAPTLSAIHDSYLMAIDYCNDTDKETLLATRAEWASRHVHPRDACVSWDNPRDPDKVLRVGLVSADFRRHPVGYFLLPLLQYADPSRLSFYVYANGSIEDDLSHALKERVAAWHWVMSIDDRALVEQIRADGIDILIDLSNHSDGNRLLCFARKPAPLQATWYAWATTTGVTAIEYYLTDRYLTVPGVSESWFSESLVFLPETHWCYAPPTYAPAVAPPPCLASGMVTFGSFNNLIKVNADVVALWARVLQRVPDSRLLLSWRTLGDDAQRSRLQAAFAACGIAAERLLLTTGGPGHADVLADYNRVDIAFDPFPVAGGLTTMEALWMGVPLITLPDQRPCSRLSVGALAILGHPDWVAQDADDFVRIAVEVAADPARLAPWRQEQRPQMAASVLCDGARFARNMEATLRTIWREWCGARTPTRRAG